jgi:Flagellar basal body rod protein
MTFDAIAIAGSGLTAHRVWLDAVSDNLSNMNTAVPGDDAAFRQRYVAVEAADAGGVEEPEVVFGSDEGRLIYEPDNPLANEEGYVRYPDIDLGEQMGYLILAQRGYEANAAVVDRAKTTYEAALQIGKR